MTERPTIKLSTPDAVPLWAQVGGTPTFEKLVAAFYARVATDPILRPMYPDDDLDAAARRLQLFLEQYWGGPHTYNDERGHPRLRMRHAPFPITMAAHDAWLTHMRAAMDTIELTDDQDAAMWEHMVRAADMLVNTDS